MEKFCKKIFLLSKKYNQIDVVSDQIGSPTNASDLARFILTILPKIKTKNVELYHYSNEGSCSWYDFAKAICKKNDINIKLNPVKSNNLSNNAKRPSYSVLNTDLIKRKFNVEIPNWKDSLSYSISLTE